MYTYIFIVVYICESIMCIMNYLKVADIMTLILKYCSLYLLVVGFPIFNSQDQNHT